MCPIRARSSQDRYFYSVRCRQVKPKAPDTLQTRTPATEQACAKAIFGAAGYSNSLPRRPGFIVLEDQFGHGLSLCANKMPRQIARQQFVVFCPGRCALRIRLTLCIGAMQRD